MREKVYRFIRWSERFMKADILYLAKGGFWVGFGQVITNLLSFLLVIAFANLLPKETFGLYRYVLSLAAVFNIFTLMGMNQAVSQAVATGNEGALKKSVGYQLKWNMLMTAAMWALGGYYFFNDNLLLATSFLIMGVFSPLTAAFNTYGAYLTGKKEFRLNNIFSVLSMLIYVIGMFLAIVFSGKVIWLVAAYSFSTFLATFIFYIATLRILKPVGSAGDVLQYGRQLTFISFMGPIVSQVDKIILNHFWGPVQLATYSLATAIPDRIIPLMKDWVEIGFPKLATRTPEEINTVFYKRIFQGLAIGFIFALGYSVSAPYVFKYLLPQYLDTVFYSQLLAINFIFALPTRYLGILYTAQKLPKLIFANNVSVNIIRILLYILLGIWGGILGLVTAHIVASCLSLVLYIIVWKFRFKETKLSTA